jgi:hypothetical protein
MNPSPDPELELLRSGLESYLPAMNAIVAFRERIVRQCRTVMDRYLADYAAALSVELKTSDVYDWDGPPLSGWNGKWASLGVQLKRVGPSSAYLVLAVGWLPDDPGEYSTGVSFWASSGAPTRAAKDLFQPPPANWWDDPKSFGLSTWHTPDAAPQLEEHLTAVLEQWIELWRKVGGLKALSGK